MKTDLEKNNQSSSKRFKPWLFLGVLLSPAIISLIALSFDDSNYGEVAIYTWAITSILAGIFCGVHFTLAQRSMQTGLKIVIGIASVIGCIIVAAALGMGGCSLVLGLT